MENDQLRTLSVKQVTQGHRYNWRFLREVATELSNTQRQCGDKWLAVARPMEGFRIPLLTVFGDCQLYSCSF